MKQHTSIIDYLYESARQNCTRSLFKKKITEILAVSNLMSSVDLDRHQNSF